MMASSAAFQESRFDTCAAEASSGGKITIAVFDHFRLQLHECVYTKNVL